jgi:hypothetical protein
MDLLANRHQARQSRAWRRAVGLAAALGIAASAVWATTGSAATGAVEARVPFRVGETLTYDVGWSTYLTAGTVVATVKEKKPSYESTAYYIVAEGRPTPLLGRLYPVYYKLDALLDSFTLLSQRGAIYSEEGGHRRFRATRFDRAARRAFFEGQVGGGFAVPPDAQDPLAAVYALRALTLEQGRQIGGAICDNGVTFKARLEVAGLERVAVPGGEFRAWKIRGAILDLAGQPQQDVGIWISADPRRLPVKLQAETPFGTFSFMLRDAR